MCRRHWLWVLGELGCILGTAELMKVHLWGLHIFVDFRQVFHLGVLHLAEALCVLQTKHWDLYILSVTLVAS